jgi:hypothetical protein
LECGRTVRDYRCAESTAREVLERAALSKQHLGRKAGSVEVPQLNGEQTRQPHLLRSTLKCLRVIKVVGKYCHSRFVWHHMTLPHLAQPIRAGICNRCSKCLMRCHHCELYWESSLALQLTCCVGCWAGFMLQHIRFSISFMRKLARTQDS